MHRAATPRPTAQSTHELSPLRSWEPNASQRPMPAAISGKVPGSGMAGAVAGTTAVSVEKICHGSRPVEVHIHRESEPIDRIGRESRNRPGGVGEHTESECSAGS